ncbi:hypothetical protein CDL12_23383 [Handroanthus impetiginosus]|uniref:Uncharacterized protein n=1 Tax=Handroanthus impetiginosus TaxID=429701 RepID=A0A2G9GFU3_9LAMI|nr:hypothetical protein CDL12_23383 [Handroanthus impetiginosus]
MAETQQKRLREESNELESDENSNSKRQKPYNNILSLLDEEEEEEPNQDLSAIFTTLQQELSSSTSCDSTAFDFGSPPFTAGEEVQHLQPTAGPSTSVDCGEEDDGVKSVMRHLLEASDDELGIPNKEDNNVEISFSENFPFAFSDNGLWELEDVAANYYTMLQSELFM